jgi:small conductance mechanosensitive channel
MDLFELESIQTLIVTYGLSILGAIVTIIIGRWLAGILSRLLQRALTRTGTNEALVKFAGNLAFYAILAFAVIAALEQVGVQTTSFIAVVGAAGLAIGLALQGSLANFAAGVMILLFKPFEIGHLVEAAGAFGRVEGIQIFNTVINTPDNKTVIVPNGEITSGNIVNYSKKGTLRVDMVFGIGYTDDLLKAKRILEEILAADERILSDPPPTVAVSELADSSVNFAVRPYAKVSDYWHVYFNTHEQVKLRFDAEGISIPFPQQDVHLFQPN